jgi:pilus assembly protein CpaF
MFGQKLVRTSATMDDSAAAETVAVLEAAAAPVAVPIPAPGGNETLVRSELFKTIRTGVFSLMNASAAVGRTREQMKTGVEQLVLEIAEREHLNITIAEQGQIVGELLNDMFGLGPIEPLLADETITDVLVNGPDQVYVERHGRLELTPFKFRQHARHQCGATDCGRGRPARRRKQPDGRCASRRR